MDEKGWAGVIDNGGTKTFSCSWHALERSTLNVIPLQACQDGHAIAEDHAKVGALFGTDRGTELD